MKPVDTTERDAKRKRRAKASRDRMINRGIDLDVWHRQTRQATLDEKRTNGDRR